MNPILPLRSGATPRPAAPPAAAPRVAALAPVAAADVAEPAPPLSAEAVLGVLQLGPARVALPLDVLREVIPRPARFDGLPAAAPGLLGAMSVRGKVLPVLDLRVALGLPAEPRDDQVVVLMRHAGRSLGLLCDGVRGLTRLAAGALDAIGCGEAGVPQGASLLFSGSFEHAADGSVVSVLDAAAVMRLPGLPLLRERAAAADGGRPADTGTTEPLMLLRCGAFGLALDVTRIHTTLPRVTLHASSLDGPVCRGVIEHAGARIPAVDPLALMQLGRLPAGEACQALLLKYERGHVALLVSQIIDIVRVPQADLLPLPPLAVRRPELFRAALRVEGRGDQLVLGSEALHREPELVTLSTLNTLVAGAGAHGQAGAATGVGAGTHGRGKSVITYELDAEVATELTQVSEVLPLPADFVRPASAHPAVLGLFNYRGHAVTLVCLSQLLDGRVRPDPAQARVLLVSLDDGGQFGFVVPRLCHIESATWEAARLDGGLARGANVQHPLRRHAAVELGQGAQRRTLHLVDLAALARAMVRGEGADAAPCEPPMADAAPSVEAAARPALSVSGGTA